MSVLEPRELEESPLSDLHAMASELGIESYRRLRRDELIAAILRAQGGEAAEAGEAGLAPAAGEEAGEAEPAGARRRLWRRHGEREEPAAEEPAVARAEETPEALPELPDETPEKAAAGAPEDVRSGILDILPNGSGFMRIEPFSQSRDDVYVSPAQIRRCELRAGDELSGPVRPPRRSERHPSLVRVDTVNGAAAEPPAERPRFEGLTPVFAKERLAAPEGLEEVPFGKGSRVAISGLPGAGGTALLRRIVATLAERHPELGVVVVLAGVRPEEVTDWRGAVSAPVAGSGFDRPIDEQAQATELAIERAKRAAERGEDAAVVIDSLDALPAGAARRAFGAARNTEESGSLTVIAATGLSPELQRVATTRIVLEAPAGGEPRPAVDSAWSGTLRADLLA